MASEYPGKQISRGQIEFVLVHDGVDGNGIEFVYLRTNTSTAPSVVVKPDSYVDSNGHTYLDDDFLPKVSVGGQEYECTDSPVGVDGTHQYEWIAQRVKGAADSDGRRAWLKYEGAMTLWSKWGERGTDGDGVEYVFIRTADESTVPTIVNNNDYTEGGVTHHYTDDDFRPMTSLGRATDDPLGVSEQFLCEWVAMRTKGAPNAQGVREWLPYDVNSQMKLWAKYALDGDTIVLAPSLLALSDDGTSASWYRRYYTDIKIKKADDIISPYLIDHVWVYNDQDQKIYEATAEEYEIGEHGGVYSRRVNEVYSDPDYPIMFRYVLSIATTDPYGQPRVREGNFLEVTRCTSLAADSGYFRVEVSINHENLHYEYPNGPYVNPSPVSGSSSLSYAISHATDTMYGTQATDAVPLTVGSTTKNIFTQGSKTANTVLAAPNGSAGEASFRALVEADIPTLSTSKISGLGTAATRGVATSIGPSITNLVPGSLLYSVLGDSFDSSNTVKSFINSSIATATADYKNNHNVVSDLGLAYNAAHSAIEAALGQTISGADNNDYCFVEIPTSSTDPTQLARIERYKFNGTSWAYEYVLNNSSFTAAQWASINSGITASQVSLISGLNTRVGDLESRTNWDDIFAIDSNGNVYIKQYTEGGVTKSRGFSTFGFITAGGVGSGSGGGGGVDIARVWQSLTNNPADPGYETTEIAPAHIPDMAATYGYLKSADLAGYLPLSGGTLTNGNYEGQLTIKRNDAYDAVIKYENSVGYLGSIGIEYNGRPYFTNDHGTHAYYLYHSGNLDLDTYAKYDSGNILPTAYRSMGYGTEANGWSVYGPAISFGSNDGYTMQLQSHYTGGILKFRNINNGTAGNWNTIYHSGNSNSTSVAWSASSLTLAGTITGATGVYFSSYSTIARGSFITGGLGEHDIMILAYDGSNEKEIRAICSQFTIPVGNFSIGTDSPAEKLHVAGNILYTGVAYKLSNSTTHLIGGYNTSWGSPAWVSYDPALAAIHLTRGVVDDELYFNTGNTKIVRADLITGGATTGDLGIYVHNGTTWSKLFVWSSEVLFYSAKLTQVANIDDILYFDTTNSRIGIGTSSPERKLDVAGQFRVTLNTSVWGAEIDNTNAKVLMATNDGSGMFVFNKASTSASYSFFCTCSDTNLNGGGTTLIAARCDGKVGIRTDSPAYTLDVAGHIGGTSFRGNYLECSGVFGIGSTASFIGSGTGAVAYVYGSNPFEIWTNGVSRLQVDGSGNIHQYWTLISTPNRIALKLRETGDGGYSSNIQYMSAGEEALVFSNGKAQTSFIFKCGFDLQDGNNWRASNIGTPTIQLRYQSLYVNTALSDGDVPSYNLYVTGNSYFAGNVSASGTIFSSTGIYSDGYVTAGAAASSSDKRLKENISDISRERAKSIIMSLKPSEWIWNDKHFKRGKMGAGFIAQDVEGVLPFAVLQPEEYKYLEYNDFHGFEVRMLQDHQLTLDNHEARLEAAEREIIELKRENAELRARINN